MTTMVRQIDGVSVLEVDGRVVLGDDENTLVARVRELLDRGERRIVLNLAGVPYMDSCGVGRLVECLTEVRSRAGNLKLANSSPKVGELLEITGLHRVFESFGDERTAVLSF